MFSVDSLPKARRATSTFAGFHFFSASIENFINGEIQKNVNEYLSQAEIRKCSGFEFEIKKFNYDFDSESFTWCCNSTRELDSVEFMLSLYYDSNPIETRIILQGHRLKGSHSMFHSIMQSFTTINSNIWTPLKKSKMSKPHMSKGFPDKILPGYHLHDISTRLMELISSCYSFIQWTKSDPLESLRAFSTALPSFSYTLLELLNREYLGVVDGKDGNIEKYQQTFTQLYEVTYTIIENNSL